MTDERRWYVCVDGTPDRPESPLLADEAVAIFLEFVKDDPDEDIAIVQCTAADLAWAYGED